eukprot:CAMPEP_0171104308 /NCGR_PEP_ID=MMETSP0766_2-20121228/60381_1 /TAXON_ID=439317 /ORGANISM="Gambierdiscus australes, Strain CAWD 149" /LENGTH=425 /DNA_ID=CAMNT_0011564915 /DNA_START=47 /DNA_END=1324 /DNA_ORIENTATION=-
MGNGRHLGTARRPRCTLVLVLLFSLCVLMLAELLSDELQGGRAFAWRFTVSPYTTQVTEPKVHRNRAARAALESPLQGSSGAVDRRSTLLAGTAAVGIPSAATAEGPVVQSTPSTAKIQRVLVNVGNKEALEKEVKFWTEACQMKVLSDVSTQDGNREVAVGFTPESERGGFALLVKEDPAVLKRPSPRLLNYDVMQPTVNALNFMQIGATGKVVEIFNRVQNAGGASLFGDFAYLDVESPRGVSARMVPRGLDPTVEFISFNVEVPAFEGVTKFYKRSLGLKELRYSDADPPVQPLSVFLGSDLGGPNLLLSPVPDQRLKNRALDEFEGLLLLSPDVAEVARASEAAMALNEREEREKEEKIKRDSQQAQIIGRQGPSLDAYLEGTRARPTVQVLGKTARLDDGVGNVLFVTDQTDFERVLATA